MLKKIQATARAANALLTKLNNTDPSIEIVYRALFLRELELCGVKDSFYPVGAAANHGFMYLLARLLRTFEFATIVELGAGQTSLLIDQVTRALGRSGVVLTVEHDAFWAERIRSQVRHSVIHAPLRDVEVSTYRAQCYDIPMPIPGNVELLIIDGPPAFSLPARYARLGALAMAQDALGKDFVVIVDDVQRPGETKLAEMLERHLQGRGVEYRRMDLRAAKSQALFSAGRFMSAAYF